MTKSAGVKATATATAAAAHRVLRVMAALDGSGSASPPGTPTPRGWIYRSGTGLHSVTASAGARLKANTSAKRGAAWLPASKAAAVAAAATAAIPVGNSHGAMSGHSTGDRLANRALASAAHEEAPARSR